MEDKKGPNDGWFEVLELEVNRQCNLKCHYCPQGKEWYRPKESFMSDELFDRIVSMASEIQFAGRLSFHHYNEPLLRKDLATLVRKAREKLPLAYFVLYTNGVLLSDSKYTELLEAGIDKFFVSNHSLKDIPERPFQEVRFPGDFLLSGRAGIISELKTSTALPCFAPSEMLIVRYDGKVVLCHEDAEGKQIMGDLNLQSLESVWFSEKFQSFRKHLTRGDRYKAGSICTLCDNQIHPLPATSI